MKVNAIKQLVKDIDPEMSILDREGEYLYKSLLRESIKRDTVVEIGSWKGRSTIWIGSAIKHKGGGVVAIDPCLIMGTEELKVFYSNIKKANLTTNINICGMTSKDYLYLNPRYRCGHIFIDGDHSYEGVSSDFNNWEDLVRQGGLVMFHDTIAYQGPWRLINEILLYSCSCRFYGMVGQLVVFKKTKLSGWTWLINKPCILYKWAYDLLFILAKSLPQSWKEKIKNA